MSRKIQRIQKSTIGFIAKKLTQKKIIEKSGSWYSYAGERIGQGRETAIEYLKANPDLAQAALREVYKAYGIDKEVNLPGAGLKGQAGKVDTEKTEATEKADAKKLVENSPLAGKSNPKKGGTQATA